jgi:mannose-1-phosphate guanylyltransferase
MIENTYVAIMAGGVGSRFWPASRTARPKQFLDILGVGKSLIQLTYERFRKLVPKENIFVVTNNIYHDLVEEHLPDLTDNQILCEPSRNNTAPCVAYTAFKLHALDPLANFIIAPSDHIILKEEAFLQQIQKALAVTAKEEVLVTLGIAPTRPDTGYGYIKYDVEKQPALGVFKVDEFKEKPSLAVANQYLAAGNYLWNAGIFVWRASTVLSSFEEHAPDIYDILGRGRSKYNSDKEQDFINKHYPDTPSISVDYAIMENAKNIYTIPSDIGWSDLGTWASLHAESPKDEHRNSLAGNDALLENVEDCLVRLPKGKTLVARDLDDYIIVDEDDVLLIYPKSKEQDIKAVTRELKEWQGGRLV